MQATLGTVRVLSLNGFSEAALIWLYFNDLNLRIHHFLPMISSKLPRAQACFVLVSVLLQHHVWIILNATNGKISSFFTTSLLFFTKSQSSLGFDPLSTLCSCFSSSAGNSWLATLEMNQGKRELSSSSPPTTEHPSAWLTKTRINRDVRTVFESLLNFDHSL